MVTPARSRRASHLLFLGLAAFAVFCVIAAAVLTGTAAGFDRGVQRWVDSHQYPVTHEVFFVASWLLGITAMRVIAVVGAAALWRRGRRREASVVVLVLIAATVFYEVAKAVVARSRPSPGHAIDPTFSFPSGHATVSAAVCFTLLYAVRRGGLVQRSSGTLAMLPILAAVAVPLIVGVSRVYLDMHWATDVVGGWCAGVAVAGIAAALHEAALTPETHS